METRAIFKKLPEIEERSRKIYLLIFLIIMILLLLIQYSPIITNIFNKLQIEIDIYKRMIFNIGFTIITIIIIGIVLKNTLIRDIKYYIKNRKDYLKYGFSTVIVFEFITIIVQFIIFLLVKERPENEIILEKATKIYLLIYGIFLGPIMEELIFRGLLKKIIKNKYFYLISSSIIFGAMHMNIGTNNFLQYLYIIPYSLSGFGLAYNYQKTDNLISPIVMHMIMNTTASFMVLF